MGHLRLQLPSSNWRASFADNVNEVAQRLFIWPNPYSLFSSSAACRHSPPPNHGSGKGGGMPPMEREETQPKELWEKKELEKKLINFEPENLRLWASFRGHGEVWNGTGQAGFQGRYNKIVNISRYHLSDLQMVLSIEPFSNRFDMGSVIPD